MKYKPSILWIRAVTLVLLLLSIGLLPVPKQSVQAQSSDLTMKVTAAYNGYFKYGEWLPVWVELSNQGNDLNAEIRIQVNSSQGALIFSSPVELPSGSRKRVPVYVLPNNYSRELDVRLVSDEKALVTQKATVRPQPNISYFVGMVAPERGALAMLNGVRFTGQERPKILVDLTLEDLPERAEGLRAFDLLVFNDIDTSTLSPEQINALTGWVQQGGRLVIGGGAGAQRTAAGLPENLLPMRVQSTGELSKNDLPDLAAFAASDPILTSGPYVVATGESLESKVLVGTKEQPQVLERTVGQGVVDFVIFDLAGTPFNGWPGTQAFWQKLIGPSGSYPDYMPFDMSPRQYRANTLSYPLSNIPTLDLPSINSVSILLAIYILIVGPVNYLVLRRGKRMHWAWVTIPVITLLFTGAAFGIGYTMRGNDLILNKIALIETKPNGTASITSYMGLFSPRMQSYEILIEGENLISPISGYDPGPWGATGTTTTGSQMILEQGQPAKVKGLTVNQWAMQSFMAEGSWEDFGGFTGSLRMENEALVGTVRNDSKYPLTDVVVTMQSRFARLGDMAPGEEKKVDVALSNLQSDRFGTPLSYRLFQERFPNGPMPRDIEQKSNILSSIFENGPWSKLSSRMMPSSAGNISSANILIFGWLDQAPPIVTVENNTLTQKTTALVFSVLDYTMPESGFLSIPAGMINGSMTKSPQNGGNCGVSTSVQMASGQAEFEYQLPAEIKNFQVDTLKLSLWRDSGNQMGMPIIALYNWQTESWVSIQEPIQGVNIIQGAAPYVNGNGSVRVQVSSQTDTFGCIYLDLGLEATGSTRQGG